MNSDSTGTMRRSDFDQDFLRFHVARDHVDIAEDGRRSGEGAGQFEWWYFDATFDVDGYVAVLFFSKPFAHPGLQIQPLVSISIKRPGQPDTVTKTVPFSPATFAASVDACDVTIDGNTFAGNLTTYRIQAHVDVLEVDATLTRLVEPLRLGTGHLLFENVEGEHFFGWLAAVPRGQVTLHCKVNGQQIDATGDGYHDHNWGDVEMSRLIHHWYWARATVGGYTVIAVNLVSRAAYGSMSRTEFVLIDKEGRYLARGPENVVFNGSAPDPDPVSGVSVASQLTFTFNDGATSYLVTFDRRDLHLRSALDGQFTKDDPEASGVYFRFASACSLSRVDATGSTLLGIAGTTWELMWFGGGGDPRLLDLYASTLTQPKDASSTAPPVVA